MFTFARIAYRMLQANRGIVQSKSETIITAETVVKECMNYIYETMQDLHPEDPKQHWDLKIVII